MKRITCMIPYGTTSMPVKLPADRLVGVACKRPRLHRAAQPKRLIDEALRHFTQAKRSFAGKNIAIVVSDLTRHAHVREILPPLLRVIAPVARKITILVGTGLHRDHSDAELDTLIGRAARKRHRVLPHTLARGSLVDLGITERGIPRLFDRQVMGHDLIISIGVIEPHLYAGYSGGAKTVAIGLAGEGTISATHGTRFLDDPTVRIGETRRNAFQRELWQIADRIAPRWLAVNVVNDPDGRLARVFAGEVRDVYRRGVEYARGLFEVGMKRMADIVICGIGHPKDVNLYQASRALNYVAGVRRPIVRKGGVVIIAADLKEGVGEGISEKRFAREFKHLAAPGRYRELIRRQGCRAGVHRAYMVARALERVRCIIVTRRPQRLAGLPLPVFSDMREALGYAEALTRRDARIAVIPRALCTIATIS